MSRRIIRNKVVEQLYISLSWTNVIGLVVLIFSRPANTVTMLEKCDTLRERELFERKDALVPHGCSISELKTRFIHGLW